MIHVRDVAELKAVVLAFKQLPRDITRDINAATRSTLGPIWVERVNAHITHPLDRLVMGAGVRVKAGNPPVLQAAQSVRGLGKTRRFKPANDWRAVEFGANQGKQTTYTRRSTKGGTHTVTRHTARQLPPRSPKGRVAYPALAETAPRAAALWVQTVVRRVHLAAEGRTGA